MKSRTKVILSATAQSGSPSGPPTAVTFTGISLPAKWHATACAYAGLRSAEAAPLLEVAPGVPLLSVSRVSFTYGDRPVELRRGLYDTSSHHYRNALS